MGKASKNRASEKRRLAKRAAKEARRQLYKQWAEEGKNKKSKRAVLRGKRSKSGAAVSHPEGPCGNIGCDTCRLVKGATRQRVCHRVAGTCGCAAKHHAHTCKCGQCRIPNQKPKRHLLKKAA